MRARIMKINDKTVVIKYGDKFKTVSKKELDFDYKVGSYITIEKNGDEFYFLPAEEKEPTAPTVAAAAPVNINQATTAKESPDGLAIVGLAFSIIATLFGLIIPSAGTAIDTTATAVYLISFVCGCLFRNLSKTQKNGVAITAKVLMWINIIFFILVAIVFYA